MFVIEANRSNSKWISGVFLAEEDATAFFARFPDRHREYLRIYEIPFAAYPVFMIESDGFRFVSRDDAINAIRVERVPGEDVVYFNVYRFSSDYAPRKPGTDYMGAIPHHHIDNWALDNLQSPDQDHFQEVFPDETSGQTRTC
jgi:hypothetical protein